MLNETQDYQATSVSEFQATYSAEDNKLRIYCESRLPEELYKRVRACGFLYAPKQELFVAPSWSPEREDLCIELAGCIEAEDMTVAERAEIKAARLEGLAFKREAQSNAFSAAARRLLDRMVGGQPILVGHHSERRHRKDIERSDSQQRKAIAAADQVSYWMERATGVERHANRKNKSDVRARRIKTLLAELRDHQRYFNHAERVAGLWATVADLENDDKRAASARYYSGSQIDTGATCSHELYNALYNNTISVDEFLVKAAASAEAMLNNLSKFRWLQHTLNRLDYERDMLGGVTRYEGELTCVILQAFARENGAYKPVAVAVDGGFTLSSSVSLPAHVADGCAVTLTSDDWITLMFECGYSVPEKKEAAAPILNFNAHSVFVNWFGIKELKVLPMTKEQYSAIYADYRGVKSARCQGFRVRICKNPAQKHLGFAAEWCVAYLTDSKSHDVPDSDSVVVVAALEA